ncbi:MAG: RNA polymerase sigma factor [Pirellulaceae bacterium]
MNHIATTIRWTAGSPAIALPRLPGWLCDLLSAGGGEVARAFGPRGVATAYASRRSSPDPVSVQAAGDDAADIRACLEDDKDAFARLVQRYQQPVANYLWRFTQDPAVWEELAHEVFVQAYLGLAKFDGRAPLLHWLKRIATRVGYGHWKQRQRGRRWVGLEHVSEAALAVTDREMSPDESHELVQRLLERVSPRDRLVLTLAYLESHTTEEIALLTGWSRSLVKVQLHRARKRMARVGQSMGMAW